MLKEQQMVAEFNKQFGGGVSREPTIPSGHVIKLRYRLITEELGELMEAFYTRNTTSAVKELADLLYVVLGTAVAMGIDIEPIFAEVHRSNMTKIGGHMDSGGKWIKPDTYSPAKIFPIIKKQICGERSMYFERVGKYPKETVI